MPAPRSMHDLQASANMAFGQTVINMRMRTGARRASARGSYRPADACEDADEALTEQQRLEKAGGSGGSGDAAAAASFGLRALAAAPDGRVFAGFASGHLKCYSALGRFLFKKVRALVARSACIAVRCACCVKNTCWCAFRPLLARVRVYTFV